MRGRLALWAALLLCLGVVDHAAAQIQVVGAVEPAVVNPGDSVLFTFRPAAGQPPLSMTQIEVDLTAIGWGTIEPLVDDGQAGDVTAFDGVYSRRRSVGMFTPGGVHRLRLINFGPQGGVADVDLTVLPIPPAAPPTAQGGLVQTLPYGLTPGSPTRLEVFVTRGTNPFSTNLSLVVDLSPIGLAADTPMPDDGGGACDQAAGDRFYTLCLILPPSLPLGPLTLTGRVADAEGRSSTFTTTATITADHDLDANGVPDACHNFFGLRSEENGASDPDGDGRTTAQECAARTHPRGFFSRYFAEGAANAFFRTRIALFNPSATATAIALVRTQSEQGLERQQLLSVPARGLVTLSPGDTRAMQEGGFSTIVESDIELVADRTMAWGEDDYGSHVERAVAAPATTWTLAEGATGWRFSLFYLLQNPGDTAAEVQVRYLRGGGEPVLTRTYTVGPHQRRTVAVDDEEFPAGSGQRPLAAADVSARIDVTNGVPIVVERAMYMSPDGQPFGAGHAAAAVAAPATAWFFAEGATGAFFDEFLLLANGGTTAANVDVVFSPEGGPPIPLVYHYVVPADSRVTIWVDQIPNLDNLTVSAQVTSDVPIVAERAMWWPGTGETWREAHASPGATSRHPRWAIAGLEVGGPHDARSYILVSGGGSVSLYPRFPATPISCGASPGGRFTVDVRECAGFPSLAGATPIQVAAIVDGTADTVVEWATYSSAAGVPFAAGGAAVATPIP